MVRLFALFLVLALLQAGDCENRLPVTVLESDVPAEVANAQAVYDQNDTVFLVGGGTNGYYITKYSVSNDSYTILPSYTPTPFGSCVWGGSDNFYYLERNSRSSSRLFKLSLNPFRNVTISKQLGALEPAFPAHGSIVSDGEEYAYIIGGADPAGRRWVLDKIYRISMLDDRTDEVVRIPSPRFNAFSMYDQHTKSIFMLGGTAYSSGSEIAESVLQYDTVNGTFSSFDPPLERRNLQQVVWVSGTHAYALIIYVDRATEAWNVTKWSPSPEPGNRTEVVKLEFEEGADVEGATAINSQSTAVYVAKLKRVYIFGNTKIGEGQKYTGKTMYIDLASITSGANVNRLQVSGIGIMSFVVLALTCALRIL